MGRSHVWSPSHILNASHWAHRQKLPHSLIHSDGSSFQCPWPCREMWCWWGVSSFTVLNNKYAIYYIPVILSSEYIFQQIKTWQYAKLFSFSNDKFITKLLLWYIFLSVAIIIIIIISLIKLVLNAKIWKRGDVCKAAEATPQACYVL